MTGRDDINDDGKFERDGFEIRNGPAPGFEGVTFKVAPKVDQTEVYDAVFDTLSQGGCIGIFPEGGSHDRPELLPLKGTVA
jgi:glycerol-3-phosphate O-acyltransferase/dihydroxyacetone phosphate acyltransferase